MKVYDYRIVETFSLETLKPYFLIEYYHLTEKKYHPYSNVSFQTLQEAQEAIRLIRKYKEPVYHYVELEMTKQELKELLTPEFLSTLHSAVECCNWKVDMIETMEFCNWCYRLAGQPEPYYDVDFEMED